MFGAGHELRTIIHLAVKGKPLCLLVKVYGGSDSNGLYQPEQIELKEDLISKPIARK